VSLGADIGLVAAFLGGVLALLSPCGALLLPSFFAYAFDNPGRLLARTGVFYLGLVTTLVPLGVTASVATQFVRSNQDTVLAVAGIVVIGLGIATALGRGFVLLPARLRGAETAGNGPVAVYLLGLAYGLTGFCTGPILGSVLVLAAVGGQPVLGGVLLAVYALGMVVPLIALSLLWERLGDRAHRWLRGREVRIGRLRLHSTSLVAGGLLVAVGALLLTGAAVVESQTLALLGARAEEWATAAGARVPDEALSLVALGAATAWLVRRWRHERP
jgi:cytochrome c biogenesis protein CcdA